MLFQAFFAFFAVIMAVIFQRELPSFFEWLYIWGRLSRAQKESLPDSVANQIVDALTYPAQRKIGALIVFPGK